MCAVKDGPVTEDLAERGAKGLMHKAGIPMIEVEVLFGAHATGSKSDYGTPEYAKAGADGLREFMQKYEEQLKSVTIE